MEPFLNQCVGLFRRISGQASTGNVGVRLKAIFADYELTESTTAKDFSVVQKLAEARRSLAFLRAWAY